MKKIIFLFIFILYSILCCAQSDQLHTEEYGLKTFSLDSITFPWRQNGAYVGYNIPMIYSKDKTQLISYNYFKEFPFTDRLRTEVEQRILLPCHNESVGKINLETLGKNIKNLSLIIHGLDSKENIIYSDTLKDILTDTVPTSISKSFPLKNLELLDLRVNAEGIRNENAAISFTNLDLFIGEQFIDDYPLRSIPPITFDIKDKIIPIDINDISKSPEIIENKGKIIALGESVHKNQSIKKLVYNFISDQVKRSHCKLVLIEIPLEMSLGYNRYIQEDNYLLIEDNYLKHTELLELLDVIKEYNTGKHADEKVRIFGMDYTRFIDKSQDTSVGIFDYLVNINTSLQSRNIDELAVLLMEDDLQKAIVFMETNRDKLQKDLSIADYNCILHILKISKNAGNDPIERYIKRDSIMYENARFLIENFSIPGKETIVYGHAIHVNPVSTYPAIPSIPFGHYMKKQYNDDYIPLVILIGHGNTSVFDHRYNIQDFSLKAPVKGSIEYYLDSLDEGDIYMDMSPELDRLVLSRFRGSHRIPQEFFPVNLYQRYKGLFFIKKDNSLSGETIIQLTIEESTRQHMRRLNERNSISE